MKHQNNQVSLEHKIQTLERLSELGKTLTSQMNLDGLLKSILKKVSEILQPESWHLLLKDPKTHTLHFKILVNEPSMDRSQVVSISEETLSGWVALKQKPFIWSTNHQTGKDLGLVPKLEKKLKGQSFLCVPLINKDILLGVIQLKHSQEDYFTEDDLKILTTISDFTAIAIENAMQFEKIQDLTIKDDLTRLYNARYLHKLLDQEVSRADRYHKEFSMIFLDLDRFKKVNDTHGHVHGSELLKETADVILENVRDVDHCARYGGDEFVIVLPETSKEKAIQTAERIRKAIQDHIFLQDQGLHIQFTASFGIANYPQDAKSKDDLIKMSDHAMYDVKKTSKNRVEGFKKQ